MTAQGYRAVSSNGEAQRLGQPLAAATDTHLLLLTAAVPGLVKE